MAAEEAPVRPRFSLTVALCCTLLGSCRAAPSPSNATVRLVDLFAKEDIHGAAPPQTASRHRVEWRFDEPSKPLKPLNPLNDEKLTTTRGWQEGPGVRGLEIRGGRLTGTSTDDFPVIHY